MIVKFNKNIYQVYNEKAVYQSHRELRLGDEKVVNEYIYSLEFEPVIGTTEVHVNGIFYTEGVDNDYYIHPVNKKQLVLVNPLHTAEDEVMISYLADPKYLPKKHK